MILFGFCLRGFLFPHHFSAVYSRRMSHLRSVLLSAVLLTAAAGATAETLPVRDLVIGSGRLSAEVARTDRQMARGLMKRRTLAANAGMLFSFKTPRHVSMWMKDTWIPLDAAFVDACGRVVRIVRMEPLTLTMHDSGSSVMNVIEANAGWFKAHKASAGTLIPGLVTPLCRHE